MPADSASADLERLLDLLDGVDTAVRDIYRALAKYRGHGESTCTR
jgi:hypothetical protein